MLSNHKGHKGHMSVFVPFVSIPGKRHAAEFCKRLITKGGLAAVNNCITNLSCMYYKWRGIQGRKNEKPDPQTG